MRILYFSFLILIISSFINANDFKPIINNLLREIDNEQV